MCLVAEWYPPESKRISVVSCNFSQIVVALACDLYFLEIGDCSITEKGHKSLQYEVSCLDVTPLDERRSKSELVAIGLWTDISVLILSLPNLKEIYIEKLGGGKNTA